MENVYSLRRNQLRTFEAKGQSVVAVQAGKRVLIISDSDLLSNTIQANLRQAHLRVENFKPGLLAQTEPDDFDLIIVATSSPASEPLVTLFDASMISQVGQTPILIVSDRSFEANLEGLVFHLDFPFTPAELRHRVQALLAYANE
jgi:DNA-binding response OmpR family regulator